MLGLLDNYIKKQAKDKKNKKSYLFIYLFWVCVHVA